MDLAAASGVSLAAAEAAEAAAEVEKAEAAVAVDDAAAESSQPTPCLSWREGGEVGSSEPHHEASSLEESADEPPSLARRGGEPTIS